MTHKEFNEILETETNNGIDLLMQKMRGLAGKSQTEQIANMICLSMGATIKIIIAILKQCGVIKFED